MNLTTQDLQDIRAAAVDAMRDTCKIGVREIDAISDDPGEVVWTYGTSTACGLSVTTKGEVLENGSQATITNAVLRLPWDTAIDSGDRVKIITQSGETLSPSPVYAVDGTPYRHIANVQVRLRLLTEDSVL